MKDINIDFEKYLQHNGQDIFKMVKTKTNKYYLVNLSNNKIVATTKRQILERIKEWKQEEIWKTK